MASFYSTYRKVLVHVTDKLRGRFVSKMLIGISTEPQGARRGGQGKKLSAHRAVGLSAVAADLVKHAGLENIQKMSMLRVLRDPLLVKDPRLAQSLALWNVALS